MKNIFITGLLAMALLPAIELHAQNVKSKTKDTTGTQDIQAFLKKYQKFQSKSQLKNARRLNAASQNSADYETPLASYVRQLLPTPQQTRELHPGLPEIEYQRIEFSNQINSNYISNTQQQIIEEQTLSANKEIEITKHPVKAVKLPAIVKKDSLKKQPIIKKKTPKK